MQNMLPNLSSTHEINAASHDPRQVPSIRLISATPSAAGLSTDANNSFSNSLGGSCASVLPSVIAPRPDAPTRKRLVPKKSKLGLLSVGSKDKAKDLSNLARRGSASIRGGFDIYVDPVNDPELEDVIVVKKQKSRGALNGLTWGALEEVTNAPSMARSGSVSDNPLKVNEDKKWWSIGRGRKNSKEVPEKQSGKENERHAQFPRLRSKTSELLKLNQDGRARFNSLDSNALLSASTSTDSPLAKASTASDPEATPRPYRPQRSFTPESLREACRTSSPPHHSASPAPDLNSSKEQGSIALRAIRSVKSLARIGGWSHLGVNENGAKEGGIKEKKEKKGKGDRKKDKKEKKEKDRKEEKKKERKGDKENGEGTLRGKDKKDKKERKEKKEKRDREKENGATLRLSSSSFEAGSLTEGPECVDNIQTLGKKKRSILGLGLGLPSSMGLPSARSGSTASSIFLQPNRPSSDALGSRAKERMGSTISTTSSLRPISMSSSSGASVSNRESRSSVKWDEEGLQSDKREIQKEKKEKRKKGKEEGKDSRRSSEGKRRISITDVFPEVSSSQGGDVTGVDQEEEIHKRFSTAFPIVTIEEATADGHEDATEEIHDSFVYGGILKDSEVKESPQTTPVKRPRVRPMSEQLLGKMRPCAVYEDEDGVLSILDAATNDLAQLINNLDLEATPNTPDLLLRPDSNKSTDKFNGSPVKKARPATESPLKSKNPSTNATKGLGLRPSVGSISSLRPYAQSRGKATKTLTTPVFTSSVNDATIRKNASEFDISQPIKPWPVLLQQISPMKERHDAKGGNKENAPLNNMPSKNGTWKKGHKRTITPGPEPEPAPVFHPLRPPKGRTLRVSDAVDGKATLKPSASSIFAPLAEASKHKHDLKGSASPPSSLRRKASAFLRRRSSLLPVPVDVSMDDVSLTCSSSGTNSASSPPLSDAILDLVPAEKRRRRMPATLGGSGVSCYAVPGLDASDPDSDIPDELQDILKANNNGSTDDDTFDFNKRFIRDDDDSGDVERPRSILPPLDFPDLPSEILSAPVFSASLSSNAGILGDIDEGEHADMEFDPDADTKKSFDFTGELRRLNEFGASDRHSFVEQLENAFKTPATLDLRCDFGGLLQVEVPPVPRLPSDLDVCRRTSRRVSFDVSKLGEAKAVNDSVVVERCVEQSGIEADEEPEAFDIYKVSRIINVKDPSVFGLQSTQPTRSNMKKLVPHSVEGPSLTASTTVPPHNLDSSPEVDSANVIGRIIISADPTEDLRLSHSPNHLAKACPSNGELNALFKFGGLPCQEVPEQAHRHNPPLTLSDIIPPPSHVRSLSGSSASSELAFEDDSLFKSILAKVSDPPQPRPRVASDASSGALQARQSMYRHSQASSVSSFTGFDSFEEVRRGFEFNSQRPGFYPPPATNSSRVDCHVRDSVMSIASVSSYGRVINPGVPDPFDFGLPSLQERPLSENLSTMSFSIDDTFSFLKHPSRRRRRVDSDASSFYFHAPISRPRDRRRESAHSVTSQPPPVSLFNRSFGGDRRNDSSGSIGSRSIRGHYHRFNASTDSIMSDFSAMRLGRPGLGDKMFDTADQAIPLSAISASPTSSPSEYSTSQVFNQPTLDSILDGDRRNSVDVSDSIFDKTGQRTSVISEGSIFGRDDDACIQPGHLPSYQFRPLSFLSTASVHSSIKDDDTMISMLGGGHVRRRSIGSIMAGSPCARAEKRKHATFQDTKEVVDDYASPNKTRIIERPAAPPSFQPASARLSLSQHDLSEEPSLEESCFVGHGEDNSTSFRPVPVFTRPPPASRSRSSTLTSFGGDTPPLSACDGASISGSSLSSLDLSDIDTMLSHSAHSISARQQVRSRVRARGHGHRRRYSHVRSSQSGSVYETIQEELASAQSSPAQSVVIEKNTDPTQVFIVDNDTASAGPDDSMSLWDDERGIAALRRYYALQDEVQSTVMESKRVWLDTPFSIFAVQSFKPPHHPEGMKALLEHSVQNYGPLPSELRLRRTRSRKDSRPSPYPQTRPVKPIASPEPMPPPACPHSLTNPTPTNTQQVPANKHSNDSSILRHVNPPVLRAPHTNDMTSLTDCVQGTIGAMAGSNTRRAALGWSQRNGVKESTDTTGVFGKPSVNTNTTSTDQKENIAGMGCIISSESSLRLNRPRPRGRPASTHPRPAQHPIRV